MAETIDTAAPTSPATAQAPGVPAARPSYVWGVGRRKTAAT